MSGGGVSNALGLFQALVLEDGRRVGDVAEPWQLEDAAAVLDQSSPTPFHFITRPRGASKTSDLAGVAVAAMLVQAPPSSRAYCAAADRDQARLFADSIRGFQARTPELRGALDVQAYRVTASRSGAVLEIMAADAPGAWGIRPWMLLIDEVAQWPSTPNARTFFEALTSAAAKIRGGRLVILTSAGDPAHWARGVLDHALKDPLWRVRETPGPTPWLDPRRVEEQRRRLSESSYRRLFLNEWTSGEDRIASLEDLRACVTLDGPQEPKEDVQYIIGVDLGLKRDRTAVAICHAERLRGDEDPTVGGRVVLDRLQVWEGSRLRPVKLDDVENWIAAASERYNEATAIIDPWQAAGLAQRLQARGVGRSGWSGQGSRPRTGKVEEFTFSAQSVGRLASTLMLLIRNRALALPDDEELISELANLRLKETAPGVLRIEHDPDKHDDRAIALALCAQKLSRDVWSMPESAEPPEDPDPRRRHLLKVIEREGELDEWVDTGQLEPWEADLRQAHADPEKWA